MKIYIVINNESITGFKKCWGLSFFIDFNNNKLLFDTGCCGEDLIFNLKKFNIEITSFKDIIISHDHWDHTGGIFSLINIDNKRRIHVGEGFSKKFAFEIESRGAKIERDSSCRKILNDIYISDELTTNMREQVLILDNKDETIILAGCSHPKIEDFAKNVFNKFNKELVIIGGFHMFSLSEQEIIKRINSLKKLNIKKIYPLHCTGELSTKLLTQHLNTEIKKAGEIIEI